MIGRLINRNMGIFGRFSSRSSKAAKRSQAAARLAEEIELLHDSPLVDPVWYRQTYPDLRDTPIDVARHYIKHGAAEGRNPGPLFNTRFYLDKNPDVAASSMNPLVHYILHGEKEGRNPTPRLRKYTKSFTKSARLPAGHSVVEPTLHAVFINYGLFNSNSGGHTAHFGNALANCGVQVSIVSAGDPESVIDFGEPKFDCYAYDSLSNNIPESLLNILRSGNTVIHAWTPRERVRRLTERLIAVSSCPYVVHLEDNEEFITTTQHGISWLELVRRCEKGLDLDMPEHLSHPIKYKNFLTAADGVTVIVDALRNFVPPGVPVHILEPGVDAETFNPNLTEGERNAARADLYIEPDTTVLAYHGNVHPANRREVFSLYTAILILRRRGHNVVLIRIGKDFADDIDVSAKYLREQNVIELGYLPRGELINVLKLADIYVQPGAVDEFNKFRLPSKIPEFLALGRPVVLPRTNIGLELKEGVEALLLDRGDALEIADKVEILIKDRELATALGKGARSYALQNLSWDVNAQNLKSFYTTILSRQNLKVVPN
jgi:glycosyltransferase involved in cell wall biosynthesis